MQIFRKELSSHVPLTCWLIELNCCALEYVGEADFPEKQKEEGVREVDKGGSVVCLLWVAGAVKSP